MPHAYTEDQLVEQPAIGLFAELGQKIGWGGFYLSSRQATSVSI